VTRCAARCGEAVATAAAPRQAPCFAGHPARCNDRLLPFPCIIGFRKRRHNGGAHAPLVRLHVSICDTCQIGSVAWTLSDEQGVNLLLKPFGHGDSVTRAKQTSPQLMKNTTSAMRQRTTYILLAAHKKLPPPIHYEAPSSILYTELQNHATAVLRMKLGLLCLVRISSQSSSTTTTHSGLPFVPHITPPSSALHIRH